MDFRIPSDFDSYDLMGYLISKVDLGKRWNDGGDALDEFSIHALNIDLYRNPEYQFWNDPKVIEAAKKYGGIKE